MKARTLLEMTVAVCALVAMVAGGGCKAIEHSLATGPRRFFSPDKVIAKPRRSMVNPILSRLGVLDTHQERVPNSTLPTQDDLTYSDKDYVIGPTDMVEIVVLDLFTEGMEYTLRRQVSESGYINLPLLKTRPRGEKIKAEGLTADRLKEAVARAYEEAQVLLSPVVSVTVLSRRKSVYSILGAIGRPGTFGIMHRAMRLMEALAQSGDVTQSGIPYIYIFRQAPPIRIQSEPPPVKVPSPSAELPPMPETAPRERPETIPGMEKALEELRKALESGSEPVPMPAELPHLSQVGDAPAGTPTTTEDPEVRKAAGRTVKWIYTNGRWVHVYQDAPVASKPSGQGAPPVRPILPSSRDVPEPRPETAAAPRRPGDLDPFGWERMGGMEGSRTIAINLKELYRSPKMNIVIRDGDVIYIPPIEIGEFYVAGEVLRPGVFSLSGRQITVKMALAAAGNLGGIAWPANSILVRRVGNSQEQIIPLDVEAIFRGDKPDVFLRPNDVLAIGTDVRAQFYIVIRNAFRMSYGFGFIWDRNFADPYTLGPRVGYNSRRFTRW